MSSSSTPELRIGVLGAARITRTALLAPATDAHVTVASVAARDPERAGIYAVAHRIPQTHTSYEALLADPSIDAVYIPLPAALHAEWTIAAIESGKHVLCEKPFTANAREAMAVAAVASASPVVVMEAYHTAYHPLTARLRQLVESGAIGEVQDARATFFAAVPPGRDIRWNAALAGGSLLDVGYYPVRMLRDLFGEPEVLSATARRHGEIDATVTASLRFPRHVRGEIRAGMWPPRFSYPSLRLAGTRGSLHVRMPYHPHLSGRITLARPGLRRTERAQGPSTYLAQLRAFRRAIAGERSVITDPQAAVAQMRTIDAIYEAAGMRPRRTEFHFPTEGTDS